MRSIGLSKAALADLRDILDYTRRTWGLARALRYVDGIESLLTRIASGEIPTRSAKEIRPDYRTATFRRHRIFLIEHGDSILVIRILHARMDPGRHLPGEDG